MQVEHLQEHGPKTNHGSRAKQNVGRLFHVGIFQVSGNVIPSRMTNRPKVVVHDRKRNTELGSSRNEKSLRSNGLHELERHSTPTHNFKGPKTSSTKGQGATHDSICNGGEGAYWEGVDRNVWAYRTACLFHSGSVVHFLVFFSTLLGKDTHRSDALRSHSTLDQRLCLGRKDSKAHLKTEAGQGR